MMDYYMKVNRVLAEIALKNGVSVDEVRKEIQVALDEGVKKVQEYYIEVIKRCQKMLWHL
jgi:DNA-binding ferritin-like protein